MERDSLLNWIYNIIKDQTKLIAQNPYENFSLLLKMLINLLTFKFYLYLLVSSGVTMGLWSFSSLNLKLMLRFLSLSLQLGKQPVVNIQSWIHLKKDICKSKLKYKRF